MQFQRYSSEFPLRMWLTFTSTWFTVSGPLTVSQLHPTRLTITLRAIQPKPAMILVSLILESVPSATVTPATSVAGTEAGLPHTNQAEAELTASCGESVVTCGDCLGDASSGVIRDHCVWSEWRQRWWWSAGVLVLLMSGYARQYHDHVCCNVIAQTTN